MKKWLIFISLFAITYEISSQDWQEFSFDQKEAFKDVVTEEYFINNPSCAELVILFTENNDKTTIIVDCIKEWEEQEIEIPPEKLDITT